MTTDVGANTTTKEGMNMTTNVGRNLTTNMGLHMTTNVGLHMTPECTELSGKLQHMSHQEFGPKMKSAIKCPNTGFPNFSLRQN